MNTSITRITRIAFNLANALRAILACHQQRLEVTVAERREARQALADFDALRLSAPERTSATAPRANSDDWSPADQAAASAEGWNLFDVGGSLEIQREDEIEDGVAGPLASDDVAIALVYEKALRGSELHARALRLSLGSVAAVNPPAASQAPADAAPCAYVVLVESDGVQASAYASWDAARDGRLSASEAAYRTSPVLEIPAAFRGLEEPLYELLELAAGQRYSYPESTMG